VTKPVARRPRIALVINPAAGRGAALRASRGVAGALAGSAELSVLCPDGGAAGSVAALRRAVDGRPDAVVVCGGDGIVHLAANVLVGGTVPLGVIPAGTGSVAEGRSPRASEGAVEFGAAGAAGRAGDDRQRADGEPVGPLPVRVWVERAAFPVLVAEAFPRGTPRPWARRRSLLGFDTMAW